MTKPRHGSSRPWPAAGRWPLAGVLLICSHTLDSGDARWPALVNNLLAQATDNALIMAEIAWNGAGSQSAYDALLARQVRRFPDNYLLNVAAMCRYRDRRERGSERKAAIQAVRCSPGDPVAWMQLGRTLALEADDVRNGRFISQMSPSELAFVGRLYPYSLIA